MSKRQENQARRYLLGQLPAAEQEALETQFFTEPERLEEIWAVENQLVDEYVRGQLDRTERAQFEQHYLDSQPHRDRVALARQLLKTIDRAKTQASQTTQSATLWANFWAWLRGPQLAWGMALVLLLVAFLVGARRLHERAQSRAQLAAQTAQQQREREVAEQRTAAQTQNEQRTAEAAERERLRNATPAPSVTPQPQSPKIFAFVLSAGLLRGSGAPQPLAIPRGTGQVELRMRLEASDYASYQIKLRTVEGGAILSRNRLKPRANQLAVTLPANKLPAGDYILTLSGVQASAVEEVNRYFFRVTPK
jgi:Sec-independent protein translocase protein TatA